MPDFTILKIEEPDQFPDWLPPGHLAKFLHNSLKPFEDSIDDIISGIEYAMSSEPGMGGFILVACDRETPVGAIVMLDTGMQGYVPPNMVLYLACDPGHRRMGIGRKLMDAALGMCEGDVKLHVEHDNFAKDWYHSIGFQSKYAEMRLER